MKRLLCLLLAAALLLSATACRTERENSLDAVGFYYRATKVDYTIDNSPIAMELREIADSDQALDVMLQLYFNGPLDNAFHSPFPKNLTLNRYWWEGNTLVLELSDVFAALSGVDLTMACACITLTCLELTNADKVRFCVADQLLNGQAALEFGQEDLLLYDNSLERLRQNVTLYYTDSDRRFLIPQAATVEQGTLPQTCLQMVSMLLEPPDGLVSPLPVGTHVLGISVNREVCTVNLSPSFESEGFISRTAQRTCLLSITNSLTQLEGVSSVEFAVNGDRLFHYGAISTSSAFTWEETAVGPVRSGVNEYDITLYMAGSSGDALLPVPTAVRLAAGSTMADQALEALLSAPAGNGCRNPIPAGTTAEDIYVEEQCCYVSVGGTLLNQSLAEAEPAIRAITATLTDLADITSVCFYPAGSYYSELSHLFYVKLTPSADWFA